jgi:hypothetical protein
MIYDTETGTIKMFWIPASLWAITGEKLPFTNTTKTLYVFAPDAPASNCPTPAGKTVSKPIPLTLFNHFQHGIYKIDLAQPCGTVSLHFGEQYQ